MAYLLVQINDTSEAGTYGIALVWISPLQARVSSMVEALEILSSLTSEGSDWLYIFLQLYEGANHTTLPRDKHICVLPQGKAKSLSGQISQLKIHCLGSARPLVVFPIGLNGGNQSVTIDLPKALHTGSSVTTDEHPYIEVNIPMSILEEEDHASLSLGEKGDIPTINRPKTPWKPRVTLMAEVNDLLDWGMMDNYDWESEHSAMEGAPTTEVDASPPLKMDTTVLPFDTSSQASAAEMEASMGSNPIGISRMAATHSNQSSSLIVELSKLQSDAHMAIHSIFTAKRSSDLQIQRAKWDYEASLHQLEVETTAANAKAKIIHSRRDLRARVKCAKVMIKAKYDYHMTVQEARAERCTEQEESEAINKNMANHSLKSTTLHQEHMEHLQELEMHALKAENKSCQHFLVAHQTVLHQAPPLFKENLHSSYSLLLGPSFSSHQPLTPTPAPQVEGQSLSTISLKLDPKWSPTPKRQHSSTDAQEDTSMDKDFPTNSQEESSNSKKGRTANWLTSMRSKHVDAFSRDSDLVKEARAHYFTTHSWDWIHSNMEDLSDIFKGLAQEAGLLGESFFETQWSWKGLEHLRQANYIFQTQAQGAEILKGGFCQGISKGDGPKGDSWPQGPVAFLWIHLLSVVWEKRSEWGDHRKPPKDGALQIGPHMQQVLWLSYNYVGHSPETWPCHLQRLGHCLPGGHSASPCGIHLGGLI